VRLPGHGSANRPLTMHAHPHAQAMSRCAMDDDKADRWLTYEEAGERLRVSVAAEGRKP
jgi:hypothetical protein